MAYEWVDGEVITADKLNNTNDIYLVTFTPDETAEEVAYVCDKTYDEIITAYNSGKILVGKIYAEYDGTYFSTAYMYSQAQQIFGFGFTVLLDTQETSYIAGSTGFIGIRSDNTITNAMQMVRIKNEAE